MRLYQKKDPFFAARKKRKSLPAGGVFLFKIHLRKDVAKPEKCIFARKKGK